MPKRLPDGVDVVILTGVWEGRIGEIVERYGKSVKVRLRPPPQPRPEIVWVSEAQVQLAPGDG